MIESVEEDVDESLVQPKIVRGLAIVLEADKTRFADDAPLGEADIDAEQDRHHVEQQEGQR